MIQWSNFLSDDDVFVVVESNLVVIMLASVTNGESKNGIRRVAVVEEMEVSDEEIPISRDSTINS